MSNKDCPFCGCTPRIHSEADDGTKFYGCSNPACEAYKCEFTERLWNMRTKEDELINLLVEGREIITRRRDYLVEVKEAFHKLIDENTQLKGSHSEIEQYELRPCPFCGSTDVHEDIFDFICRTCGCKLPDSVDWNTRSIEDMLWKRLDVAYMEVERLEKILRRK